MSLQAGQELLHLRIVEKIGEGGMGVVWRAVDTALDREVAVKVLPAALADHAERLARFEREAKLLAALNHPNVATIHGLHRVGDLRFLTMEYVDGKPLSAAIPAAGLPLPQLFDLGIQIADALAAAHERGITHRDLKPDNVMITNEGRVKVLDFGLAKLVGEALAGEPEEETRLATATITQEGRIVGTVHYMSPEQAEGKPVDARSDVFSLGILLYEMTAGKRPFSGDTAISTISSILKDHPPSLTELKSDLPRHLDRVVRRCLSKDPERRYPNAKEIRNELEELRQEVVSGGASAISASAPSRGGAGARPRRLGAAVAVGLLAVAAIAVGWRLLGTSSEDAPGAGATARAGAGPGESAAVTSIAVLPFADLSPEGDKEYFGDGIAEELMNRLARVDGMRVAGRSSAFAFKGGEQNLHAIGEALGVEAILEGSVRSAADRVRVTAQLVGVEDGFQLWSETYDRSLSDIFAVQDEIARNIVRALKSTLAGADRLGDVAAREGAATSDTEAYQDYLKARHFLQQRTETSIRASIDLFERAVERDPSFASALAGLATAWFVLPGYSDVPVEEVLPRAREFADRTIGLDPSIAEAYAVLGGAHLNERRWADAEAAYRTALLHSPDDPTTLLWFGGMLLAVGRVDEGARLLEDAYEIDPASGVINGWLGHAFRAREERDRAVTQMREADRLGWGAAEGWVVRTLLEAGRYREALEAVADRSEAAEPAVRLIEALIEVERNPARREEAAARVPREAFAEAGVVPCLRLGGVDGAFGYLDAMEDRFGFSNNALVPIWAPEMAEVRRDPRFPAFAERIGLVEYWTRSGFPEGCDLEDGNMRCR